MLKFLINQSINQGNALSSLPVAFFAHGSGWVSRFPSTLQIYLSHDLSLESLQMAILFVDRFVKTFREEYNGEVESTPLDYIFEAALFIVDQLLDDGAEHCEVARGQKRPDNVQVRSVFCDRKPLKSPKETSITFKNSISSFYIYTLFHLIILYLHIFFIFSLKHEYICSTNFNIVYVFSTFWVTQNVNSVHFCIFLQIFYNFFPKYFFISSQKYQSDTLFHWVLGHGSIFASNFISYRIKDDK